MNNENENQKPLTLNALVTYNQEVLLPAMDERLVTKQKFAEFRNETLTGQDRMFKKLDTLLTEKTVREYQEKKEKKLWAIVISALKEHRILSSGELEQIAQLEIF